MKTCLNQKQVEENWELFSVDARKVGKSDIDSGQELVPMLGTGFLRHIFPDSENNEVTSWAKLLLHLASETGCDLSKDICDASQGLVGYWESLCIQLARKYNRQANEAEGLLREKIQECHNRKCEDHYFDNFLDDSNGIRQRRNRFLSLGFQNVLNYNFDRILSISNKVRNPRPTSLKDIKEPLYRFYKSSPINGVRQANVWHPHGDLGLRSSMMLGIRQYCLQISKIESARNDFKFKEKGGKGFHGSSWYYVAVNAPLVLLGLGLSPDEWDVWWFLTNRARNHAQLEPRQIPRLYRLVAINDGDSKAVDWLNIGQHRIIDLCADSWDEAWERFYECF